MVYLVDENGKSVNDVCFEDYWKAYDFLIFDEYNAYNRSAFAAFQYGGAGVDLDDSKELYYMHYEPCATPDIPEHEC